MKLHPLLPRRLTAALLLLLSLTLGGCGLLSKDEEKYPRLRLTSEQAAWAEPFRAGATWTFRGPVAQTHTMQSTSFDNWNMPQTKLGSKKTTIDFYRQEINAVVSGPSAGAILNLYAEVSMDNMFEPCTAQLLVNYAAFRLPVAALEAGQPLPAGVTLRPQLTLGSRTYQNVLEIQSYTPPNSPTTSNPEAVRRILYNKTEGLLQYETASGAVWTRE